MYNGGNNIDLARFFTGLKHVLFCREHHVKLSIIIKENQ